MLLERPNCTDPRDNFALLVTSVVDCSGVTARLVWGRNQPMVSPMSRGWQADAISSIQPVASLLPGMSNFLTCRTCSNLCIVMDLDSRAESRLTEWMRRQRIPVKLSDAKLGNVLKDTAKAAGCHYVAGSRLLRSMGRHVAA